MSGYHPSLTRSILYISVVCNFECVGSVLPIRHSAGKYGDYTQNVGPKEGPERVISARSGGIHIMPFVITAPCVADYSCEEICPVGSISPGPDHALFETVEQLYINPETCIDCAACVDACPVGAIYKAELLPEKWRHYEGINRKFFETSPTQTRKAG
jgi:NAD-dependent dihydropyrimidine dehydrogenase PreA subunit